MKDIPVHIAIWGFCLFVALFALRGCETLTTAL